MQPYDLHDPALNTVFHDIVISETFDPGRVNVGKNIFILYNLYFISSIRIIVVVFILTLYVCSWLFY